MRQCICAGEIKLWLIFLDCDWDHLVGSLPLKFTKYDEYNGCWYHIVRNQFDLFMLEVGQFNILLNVEVNKPDYTFENVVHKALLSAGWGKMMATYILCKYMFRRSHITASACWSTWPAQSTSSGSSAPLASEASSPGWRTSGDTNYYIFVIKTINIFKLKEHRPE